MALTLNDLYGSPDHYLHSFEDDQAVFVPMDRAAYGRSIFLDGRIMPAGSGTMRLPLSALGAPPRPAATGWIFHMAHCGSTLLARALDRPNANLVLREPLALRQCAVAPAPGRLALAAAMVSKRYRADLPTIVKANVPVNFVLPDLAAFDGRARAVFLYLGLADYLLAVLRSDNHREWLRRVTSQLQPYLGDVGALSDAERGAALWLAQMRAYAAAAAALPNARSLDAEVFFAEPGRVLKTAADHLAAPMSDDEVEGIVKGPSFATYSKNPAIPFNNEARLARRSEVEIALEPELDEARSWMEKRAAERDAAEATLESIRLLA